jgi:DNA-binding beta-propeller fold protein YncE
MGTAPKPAPTVFISTTTLRATIPSGPLSAAGQLPLVVQSQNGDVSTGLTGPAGLTVVPSRPAVVAVTPDTLVPTGANVGVNVVGGFFSPHTTVQCNGQSVASTLTSTQQLNVTIPGSCTPAPGLYPLVVQNSDVVPPNPPMAATNFAVEPLSSDISTAPSSTFAVGTSPLGIAIDTALNVAVIANTGSNTVSIVNLATNAPVPGSPVGVGHGPTAVAIDDQITTAVGTLGDHIAAVTNSLDNTLSVIDLTTLAVTTIPLPNVNTPPTPQPVPYGIGINPLTHRGLVALQATNTAVIVDFSNGVPTVVESIGGTLPALGTGTTPAVVVDPRLNWALITPGGAGTINIVDLGRNPGPGINPVDLGRDPVVIASLSISATVQGAGINTETHQVLFADPNGPNDDPVAPSLSTFSLLDESVNSVPFTQSGIPFTNLGLTAAAVNPLANIGIAVNGPANNGYVVDLKNDIVLKTVSGFNSPQAVAVNPVTNTAYIVNQGNTTVSYLPLATTTPNPLQIVESSPSTTFVQNPPAGLTLSIVGNGFTGGSKVVLDGAALPVTLVSSRHITAAIPAGDLATARRYVVYVQTGSAISNATDLTVIQPVAVGTSPVGVAVDPYLDQAVVTNSGSDSISVINLLNGSVLTPQSPSFFATGTTPFGVAILARTGQAVVVNNSSNSVTILDEKGLGGVFNTPITFPLCGQCTLPIGIALNQDTTRAAVTDTVITAGSNTGGLALFDVQGATSETASSDTPVDFLPLGVAIDPGPASDPTQDIAAIATASDTNALDILPLSGGTITRVNGLLLPTGVDFDALNQVFLVTDSSGNNVDFIDPLTSLTLGVVRTGINPTSLDYNFNASTLVTANAASNTLSVLDYLCPPNPNGVSNCPAPQVRTVYDAGSLEPAASQVIGTNSVAIDPRLNLAVQVDQTNNRVLLVPLP